MCFSEILSVCSSKSDSTDNRPTISNRISAYQFSSGGYKFYFALNSGGLYCLDFVKNWYQLTASLNCAVTNICLCEPRGHILVGLNDNSIKVLDEESGKEVDSLLGHTYRISNISVQPVSGRYALSVALNEAILWDLDAHTCRCKLHIDQKVDLISVNFIPPRGEQIISCFQDGSMYIWSTDSLQCVCRLFNEDYPSPTYRTITFTSKGHYLFAAGRSPFVYLWNLKGDANCLYGDKLDADNPDTNDQFLQELIKLPEPLKSIRRIEWIPKSCLVYFEQFCLGSEMCDELSGLLLLLGSDKRLRLLIRIHEKDLRKPLASTQNLPKGQLSESSTPIYWKCIFTFGFGSLEDPLISSFSLPFYSILDLSGWQEKRQGKSFNCRSLLAILDDHGLLHINDLSMVLKLLHNSSVPVIKVNNQALNDRKASLKHTENEKSNCETKDYSPFRKSTSYTKDKTIAALNSVHIKDPTDGLLDRKRLRLLLKEFGKFPNKYRLFIWRSILQIPCNAQAFNVLLKKVIHPAYELLSMRYPIRSQRLLKALQKICSALAYWCPLFGETDWLPLFVFPFIKLHQNNLLHAFEVAATVLINWCGTWFEFFPNPPINILCMIENLIAYADPELYRHFVQHSITTEIYAWPLLQTGLSEVFSEDEWLCLWDSLICHSPGLLLAIVAAYSICARGPLLLVQNIDTFEAYYRSQSTLPVSNIIERAHQLLSSVPSDMHPDRLLFSLIQTDSKSKNKEEIYKYFQPLTSPYYPIITRYPKFIVNYHIQERERIREEEKEYLRQKATVEDMQRRAQLMANEEHNWYRQQQLLLDAEDHRRTLLAEEENKLREQRKRLSELIREVKLQELNLAEESRCHYRQLDIRRRQCELNKLEQELSRLTNCRIDEMDAAAYAAELADLSERLHQRRAETLAIMNKQLQSEYNIDALSGTEQCFLATASPDTNDLIKHDRYREKKFRDIFPDSQSCASIPVDPDVMTSNLKHQNSHKKFKAIEMFPFTSTKLQPQTVE
ncbi:TBC1 domain family member 31 [Schistosoma japonicum]|nr:TBC1 domain family member 31 [Schistosoma japonicum]